MIGEESGETQVTLTIDDRQVTVPNGTLILKAAEQLGIEIPVFCYHDKLKSIGACRMCIVDVEGLPKPVPSCATEVKEGMVVRTRTPEVAKMWEGVLEFLLVNHPLDCPVCDRGGECPLQDNTFKYGPRDSRFTGEKRHFAKPVPLSALVLLDRERCIMCTRCVRFCQEISGDEQLKIWDRGHGEYIDTFPGQTFDSNFSGNTIELCPVGALLSSVFRFRARPWEMKGAASICPHCGVGCNIRVDARNNREVVRFLSRENAEVDDGWLCDRGRFDSDFPNSGARLTKPLARKNGELTPVEWDEALDLVAEGLRRAAEAGPDQVGGLGSPWRTNEENYLLQKLFRTALGSNSLDFTFDGRGGGSDAIAEAFREGFFDGSISDTTTANVIFVLGSDISIDLPVVDLWLKKAVGRGAKLIYAYPTAVELAQHSQLFLPYAPGSEVELIEGLAASISAEEAAAHTGVPAELIAKAPQALMDARQTLVFVSGRLLEDEIGHRLLDALRRLRRAAASGEGQEMLVCAVFPDTNTQGAMDMGLLPGRYPGYRRIGDELAMQTIERTWLTQPASAPPMSGEQMLAAAAEGRMQAMYIMGLDPVSRPVGGEEIAEALSKVGFLVVADTFLTKTAELAHVVLPSCTFAEKDGTLTNTERRVQRIRPAMRIAGECRPDWVILSEIARRLGMEWSYGKAEDVFEEIARVTPQYAWLDYESIGEKGLQWRTG
ncbi:MAG: NADH-quinone oxidoreductase subunit NuoG [Armatimonadota bacterium]|nr:NADH-quinone oxidoreductase subunit NuoG [Armatimonadota bacterium]